MRIGFSKDIHKLENGLTLMLGGVNIPSEIGPIAHSDGDVVLHAVSEAILGALAKGDLGAHFPNTIRKTKGMASTVIVEGVMNIMESEGFHVENVDVFISLENPKIGHLSDTIRTNLAFLLKVENSQVSIKFGTNEGMGPVGAGEAIVAYAVVLLDK